jgi:hypothetical protein
VEAVRNGHGAGIHACAAEYVQRSQGFNFFKAVGKENVSVIHGIGLKDRLLEFSG